jgi:hypothetical protein
VLLGGEITGIGYWFVLSLAVTCKLIGEPVCKLNGAVVKTDVWKKQEATVLAKVCI